MKRKLNIVDVILIALAVAAAVGIFALRNRSTGAGEVYETTPMQYTVEMTDTPIDMAACIHIGDGAYRSTDGQYLGTVADVYSKPHEVVEYSSAAGKFVVCDGEESSDVYLTIENDGYCTERDFMIGGVPIRAGMELAVKGKGFAHGGYVYSIDTRGADVPEPTDTPIGDLETEYVIGFPNARNFAADNFHVGDRLYESSLGAMLGEVQNVEVVPYGETRAQADGSTAFVLKPGYSTILVTLKGRCIERNDGYYLDGATELKVGGVVKVQSNYVDREGVYYNLLSIGK